LLSASIHWKSRMTDLEAQVVILKREKTEA
jgi:hypothetical protein